MRGRGSKLQHVLIELAFGRRPSCAGADRNYSSGYALRQMVGRPSCAGADRNHETAWRYKRPQVAPHARARIETAMIPPLLSRRTSPLMRGRGSKLWMPARKAGCTTRSPLMRGRGSKPARPNRSARRPGRPSCAGADRNPSTSTPEVVAPGRPSCAGADRNSSFGKKVALDGVAPHARARIETSKPSG